MGVLAAQTRYTHVVNILAVCDEPGRCAIVMELMSMGSLFNVIRQRRLAQRPFTHELAEMSFGSIPLPYRRSLATILVGGLVGAFLFLRNMGKSSCA